MSTHTQLVATVACLCMSAAEKLESLADAAIACD
jgi:hypothetical protein